MIQHQRSTVPMSGAPGMNFKMDDGESLINLGRNIADSSEKIGNAMTSYVAAKVKFFEQQQYVQDRLAATEARNLYDSLNADLTLRMTDNPAQFEKFAEWAIETDKTYEHDVLQFTEKMSPDFRKQFDAEMLGVRKKGLAQRREIGRQAEVTANYNLFQAQWKNAALSGNLEECNRMLEEERGILINEQEYQQKKLDYQGMADFGLVDRAIEAGQDGIIELLKQRNEAGGYENFKALDESSRKKFIQAAEAKDSQKRAEENAVLLDALNDGEVITIEHLEKKFNGKTSAADKKQFLQQKEMVRAFEQGRKEELSDHEAEQRKNEINAFEYRILTYEFANSTAIRTKEYFDLKGEIITKFAGDGATVKKLLSQLNESFKAKENPDSSYKNSYLYLLSKQKLEDMKNSFYSRNEGYGLKWYSFLTNVYDDSKDLKLRNYQMAQLLLDRFIMENPSAKEADVDRFLADLKTSVNWTECNRLVQFWAKRSPEKLIDNSIYESQSDSGEMLRLVNGKLAVYDQDKKFIRWAENNE